MKSLFLFVAICGASFAQELKVEQIPVTDVLRYLDIKPADVASTKFSVTFPQLKYAALRFYLSVKGKPENKHVIRLGPSKLFTVEAFLAPPRRSQSGRHFSYKLSTDVQSTSSVQFIASPTAGESPTGEYSIGARLPAVFTYGIGDVTCSLTFVSSDTPIKE
jgi:hypothetical protein